MKRLVLQLLLSSTALYALPANAQLANITDADIADQAPGEWLSYGRDYAETHHSPLAQVNAGNVSRLGLAWSWDTRTTAGQLEAVPVVVDGVMYATGTWSVVFALNARTGEEIWRWDPAIVRGGRAANGPSVCCGPVNRGVAVYEGKVFAGLLDGRLVALDAQTGDMVWVTQTTPPGGEYSITGAPRIVKGNVVIGNGGAEYGVRGFVTAYNPDTGAQVWRTYTVPGDPALGFESPALEAAAATWNGEWWKLGGGGTAWDAFAYDPEADLLYVGTGNGSPWSQEERSPGGGDNLYLASILALRPETGEYVWHFQTTPGDDWDYTATQNLILADLTIDGRERKVIMQAPKNGFFYVIDRLTGEFISAKPFTHITWATGVDANGRPIEAPGARYDETGTWIAPSPNGAHNWNPMSFSPQTGLVYIPGQNTVSFYRRNPDYQVQAGRFNTGIGGTAPNTVPAPAPVTPTSFLLAWDPIRQQERWRIGYETRRNGGTMTTSGNLLFSGTADGHFYAHNAETGAVLWEQNLGNGLGTPMTFELDGRQYITVLAGTGGNAAPGRVYTFVLDGNTPMPALQP